MTEAHHFPTLRALVREPACRALRQAAGEASCDLVGGILRDRLLEVPSRDLDAVVGGGIGQRVALRLAELLPARLVDLGREGFAAYRLVGAKGIVDLWDRHSMSAEDDLLRRDFTINSIALGLADGRLRDPADGLGDLQRRILRATTSESFIDDPLRVLRLPRLAAQLPGFTVDEPTVRLARASCLGLKEVAKERIREELRWLFDLPNFRRGFALLTEIGALPEVWSSGSPESGNRRAIDERLGRLEELRATLENRAGGDAAAETLAVDLPTARWAVIVGGGSPTPGGREQRIRRLHRLGYLTRRQRDRVDRLGAGDAELPASRLDRRRFLHRFGRDWPTALVVAGVWNPSTGWSDAAVALNRLAATEGRLLFHPPRLVDGNDVARVLGLSPGPAIGGVLDEVERLQVEGRLRSRAAALAWLEARQPTGGS